MTDLARKALELARKDIGVTEHPPGSNRGPEVDQYLRDVGLEPANHAYPWCAAFLSSKIKRAAEAISFLKKFHSSASCHRLVELNPDLLLSVPEDGCVFVHLDTDRARAHDHAGFVETVFPGGIIGSLEGNSDKKGSRTGGSVVENARPPGYSTHFLAIR
jgi:hypothetical protein